MKNTSLVENPFPALAPIVKSPYLMRTDPKSWDMFFTTTLPLQGLQVKPLSLPKMINAWPRVAALLELGGRAYLPAQ